MDEAGHPRIPTATYRLQFHAGFTFRDAREILDYLEALGISDIYASPYFQASPTSTHGYDVANHNRLNPAIGNDADFRAYTDDLRQRGMGQVLDFVPNHMGIGESLNLWWTGVLEEGAASPFARYFDIDWHPGSEALADRVMLPILGDRYGKVLENGELKLNFENGAFFLTYFEARLPINPRTYPLILRDALDRLGGDAAGKLRDLTACFAVAGGGAEGKKRLADLCIQESLVAQALTETLADYNGQPGQPASFDKLHDLLDRQAYRLSYWRVAAEEINYRRFFDVNTLAAIRVEIPEVFEAAHQLVFEFLARGAVTGLRLDHVDGLWNPREYLLRLQARADQLMGLPEGTQGLYLVVEKILDLTHERLPGDWPIQGTTGYEFANQVVQFFVESANEKRFTRIYRTFTGERQSFTDLIYEKKKLTLQISLGSELSALGRRLNELSEIHRHYRDLTLHTLTYAVEEVIACFPVYRTYVTEDGAVSPDDEKVILRAILAARRRNPTIEKPVFDFLRNLLLLRLPESLTADQRDAHIRFVMKFQQCSGPVMAKGLEDTAFYIYNRLAALNEVGGNPGLFGLDAAEFHRLNTEHFQRSPHMLLATSTHDTKRSEDVRMRLVALSEHPTLWQHALKLWSRLNRKHCTRIDGETAPSANEEYLIYQAVLGAWPLAPMEAEEARREFTGRIQQYMLKALKEAKINSSWTEANEGWEKAVATFIEKILDPGQSAPFLQSLGEAVEKLARIGAVNSLSQTILKCTVPGVPDFYQGTEIWDFSLVDPDNRRPVDYGARKTLLVALTGAKSADLMQDWKSGAIKLFVIQRLLHWRRDHAAFFRDANYTPMETTGAWARHLGAFSREGPEGRMVVVVPRLVAALDVALVGLVWQDTAVAGLDGGPWLNVLTGVDFCSEDSSWKVADLFTDIPFAILWQNK